MNETPTSRDRNYESFVRLLAEHESAIFGYILSILPSWSDAQDVYQETSVVLWRKFDEFEPGSNFVGWACVTARFKALNKIKKLGRDKTIFSDALIETMADEGESDLERLDAERRALHGCMDKLPDPDRDLVERCYAPKASIKEVATEVGRSPNAVYKWLNKVREALFRCIRHRMASEGFS